MAPRHVERRQFLAGASLLGSGLLLGSRAPLWADEPRRPKVAVVYTAFYHRSHAHVIIEKFLRPYLFNGKRITSPVDVVAFFADQRPQNGDMPHEVARQ